jgi:enoyl-CoA hydratase/carnithine racemase
MWFQGEALSWRHRDRVLEVELHRAPLNEIGTTALSELEMLARYVRAGASGARVLLWWSSRPGFCAGADLRELHRGLLDRGGLLRRGGAAPSGRLRGWVRQRLIRREIRRFVDRIHAVFDTFDQAELVTVAAAHGVVFGGGFELALTADQIVADRTARFCFPELRLGLIPGFGGIPRLRREIPGGVIRDLLLTGRSLGAARAHEVGLVSQLVPKGEALAAARRLAEQAARFGRAETLAAKRLSKPLPSAELAREKELFCELVVRPSVLQALDDFVTDRSVRPYLPAASGGMDG